MVDEVEQPCKDGLTPECFAQKPAFAKSAFAFRMLSAFVPPGLSKGLLTFLGLIRFDPSGQIPDWLNLPPWWIIAPDAIIPPDWKVGDPPFAGLLIPPIFSPQLEAARSGESISADQLAALQEMGGLGASLAAPSYLTSGGSGPTRAPNFSSPVIDPWFYDTFITLDPAVWEKWEDGDASVYTYGFSEIWFNSAGTDYCLIRTAPDDTIPDSWVLTFRVKIYSYSGANPNFYVVLYSGAHQVKFRLNPPTTVWHGTGASGDEITVDDYVGDYHIFSIRYNGTTSDLFMDGVLISSDQAQQSYSSYKGRISFDNNNEIFTHLDYISIDPN